LRAYAHRDTQPCYQKKPHQERERHRIRDDDRLERDLEELGAGRHARGVGARLGRAALVEHVLLRMRWGVVCSV
jgi:hypothetical protein